MTEKANSSYKDDVLNNSLNKRKLDDDKENRSLGIQNKKIKVTTSKQPLSLNYQTAHEPPIANSLKRKVNLF